MPRMIRTPVNYDYDNDHYEILRVIQDRTVINNDALKIIFTLMGVQSWFSERTVDYGPMEQ